MKKQLCTICYLHILLFFCFNNRVQSHGRMDEPPSRNSAWRFKFNTPKNYNDVELNCGGAGRQHASNGGKCGVCGDPYDAPIKAHELGGTYATGTIVRSYKMGQTIPITITITSNHFGHFEFRICPLNALRPEATHECLDRFVLDISSNNTSRVFGKQYQVDRNDRTVSLLVKLPNGLSCDHCVLQWKYRGGNNWGSSEGKSGLGFGPQEEFYNCADVSIEGSESVEPTLPMFTKPTRTTRRRRPSKTSKKKIPVITADFTFPTSKTTKYSSTLFPTTPYTSTLFPTKSKSTSTQTIPSTLESTTFETIQQPFMPTLPTDQPPFFTMKSTLLTTTQQPEKASALEFMFHCQETPKNFLLPKQTPVEQRYKGMLLCYLIGLPGKSTCKQCYENCSSPFKICPEDSCLCFWYS